MSTETFEIKTYKVRMARELNGAAEGVMLQFPAYIECRGDDGYRVLIYALADASPKPANTFLPASKRGTIFVPRWQFRWFLDLLRNEKPVRCYLNSDTPRWNALYTGPEPVGEEES